MEKYVTEIGARQGPEQDRKSNLLLVNKADLVSEEQRIEWADYFESRNIDFCFFSAIEEQEKIDEIVEQREVIDEGDEDESDSDEESVGKWRKRNIKNSIIILIIPGEPEEPEEVVVLPPNKWDILDKEQFKLLVKEKRKGMVRFNPDHVTVGMIGYPNVGKSSCINVLIQDKKVSVSATPGKTKHFQTLFCGDDRNRNRVSFKGLS